MVINHSLLMDLLLASVALTPRPLFYKHPVIDKPRQALPIHSGSGLDIWEKVLGTIGLIWIRVSQSRAKVAVY